MDFLIHLHVLEQCSRFVFVCQPVLCSADSLGTLWCKGAEAWEQSGGCMAHLWGLFWDCPVLWHIHPVLNHS